MLPSDDSTFRQDRFAAVRRRMINGHLKARGISDDRVLAAMAGVAREEFVPAALQDLAYDDRALKIGLGQTISQPYTVAFMCQAALPGERDRVLEIGTGSGYGAAVLSRLAEHVDTIERLPELAETARCRLRDTGCSNVTVHVGDGSRGLPEQAPFDAIIVTAAAPHLPQPLADQLAEGGRLVIPIGDSTYGQSMMRFTRQGADLISDNLGGFVFVPLIGEFGVPEDDDSETDLEPRIGF
ncbi:MAG: protein-L-isoaspartate(D-aspartate) O-methyltransferase [Planctomycetaceae bacterium]